MSVIKDDTVDRRMHVFDLERERALQGIWFLGDVHGEFSHIEAALMAAQRAEVLPKWIVFLGDVEIRLKSLREVLEPLMKKYPPLRFGFIFGYHDADSYMHWECLHDCGAAIAFHAKVVDLDGVRVAGLGGNFLGRVWAPPSPPKFRCKDEAMERGPNAWRDGQRPSPKLNGAIYPSDFAALANQKADILITHDAPSCHQYGWRAIDQLARDLGVVRIFHAHTHDDLSETYGARRDQLGFDAHAVGFRRIKNGLGECVAVL